MGPGVQDQNYEPLIVWLQKLMLRRKPMKTLAINTDHHVGILQQLRIGGRLELADIFVLRFGHRPGRQIQEIGRYEEKERNRESWRKKVTFEISKQHMWEVSPWKRAYVGGEEMFTATLRTQHSTWPGILWILPMFWSTFIYLFVIRLKIIS